MNLNIINDEIIDTNRELCLPSIENIKDGIIAKKKRVGKGELSVKISVKNKINYTNNCDYYKNAILFFV
jgi:hypothetical protein